MSSFQKTSSRSTINGTKLKNNIPHVSSGIPSLDFIIGGGLPTGSIFAVEEDILSSYSRVLMKYFLAEGVVCKHGLFIASADENPKTIVQELPKPCSVTEHKPNPDTNSEMKIAWRYEGLGQVESSFGSNSNFGHHFDLSKHIDAETIKQSDITYCHLELSENNGNGFRNNLYYELLTEIKKAISKEEYQNSSNKKNILRISIQSLGSPAWMALDCDNETSSFYGQDLIKFLYCLRVMIRDTNAVVFITIPEHLFEDNHIMKRLLYSVDNAVRIESFAGSSKESNPVYGEYHGLMHVSRLATAAAGAGAAPNRDLAFKLKRKKFVIEKLHLPPELQESSEREQDDITALPKTCGGFKKKDIEF